MLHTTGFRGIPVALVLLCMGLVPSLSRGAARMSDSSSHSSITHAPFGHTNAGTPIDLYTLRNHNAMEALSLIHI